MRLRTKGHSLEREYRELCLASQLKEDARLILAANFLTFAAVNDVNPESADEQCLRLARLAEEYGVDPDVIQLALEAEDSSLACLKADYALLR